MRLKLTLIVTAIAISSGIFASENTYDLATSIRNIQSEILIQRIDGNHWSGGYTLDVTTDAVALAIGHKTKLITAPAHKEMINSILQRMDPSHNGWSDYPGGPLDLEVTGLTLYCLEYAGISKFDERVMAAWSWFENQNGLKKIGSYALFHLMPLGVVPHFSVTTTRLLSLPLRNFGIMADALVPFFTWAYFYDVNRGIKRTDQKTAQQGIQRILAKENPIGGWYTLNFTFINLMALLEAQKAGAGDFSQNIKRAWSRILSLRTKNMEGQSIQEPLLSDIWDTASITNAFKYLPEELGSQKDLLPSLNWLKEHSVELGQGQLGWSFDSNDKTAPDVDDTAAVVHAFSSLPEFKSESGKAVSWILKMQNRDGGFPAWDKDVWGWAFKFIRTLNKDIPEIEDVSQSDITARVILALRTVEPTPEVLHAIERACGYLGDHGDSVEGIPFKLEPGHWMSNYFYSASMELGGLVSGQCQFERQRRLADWLVESQNNDGGWGESNEGFGQHKLVKSHSTISQTALVLSGLIFYNKKLREQGIEDRYNWTQDSIEKGIHFILEKSQGGKNFSETDFTAVLVKGKLFNRYELLPLYSSLYVLSEWYKISTRSDTQ